MDFVVVMVAAGMGMGAVKLYEFPVMVKINELFTIKIIGTEVIHLIQSKSIKIYSFLPLQFQMRRSPGRRGD